MGTTRPDPAAPCPLERVNRQFTAERPNRRWNSDFTSPPTRQGCLCVACVVDVFVRNIHGGRVSRSMRTELARDALKQASYARHPQQDALIHHSDSGSHYVTQRKPR